MCKLTRFYSKRVFPSCSHWLSICHPFKAPSASLPPFPSLLSISSLHIFFSFNEAR